MSAVETYLGDTLPASNRHFRRNSAQLDYAASVSQALNQGVNKIHFIEGDAGIGKTLAYLLTMADWCTRAHSKRRVIVSTFSRALQRQLVSQANQALVNNFLMAQGRSPIRFAVRMGRANYVSHRRLALALGVGTLEQAAADTTRNRQEQALAEWALSTEGCLLDLDDDALPADLRVTDIALLPGEPIPPALASHFADVKKADVLVFNHALTAEDMLTQGGVSGMTGTATATASGDAAGSASVVSDEHVLLLDEAEHFPDVAANILSYQLSYASVVRLAQRLGYRTAARRWQALLNATASTRLADTAVEVPPKQRDALLAALRTLRRTPNASLPDTHDKALWRNIHDHASWILEGLENNDMNVVITYSTVRGLPSIVRADIDAGRCLKNHMDNRITILTSATLTDMHAQTWYPTFFYLRGRLAIGKNDPRVGVQQQHSARDFGQLAFHTRVAMPYPLHENETGGYRMSEAYARRAASHALVGARGRVLILCNSYGDVDVLTRVWPDQQRTQLITHPRGANINLIAKSLGPNDVLVTPAGWEGLSPERAGEAFWARIVILRNPRQPIKPSDTLLLANKLKVRGYSKAVAQSNAHKILHIQNQTKTLHKLRQGMGRAIRHRDDRAEVIILDPRFFRKSGGGHGPAGVSGLEAAIPKRFRAAYSQALEANRDASEIIL